MRLPHLQFTLRRMMVVVAILTLEIAFGSAIYHTPRPLHGPSLWFETVVDLAFANLLVIGPAWVFYQAIKSMRTLYNPKRTNDE